MAHHNKPLGQGPGNQTLDGCSIEFYRQLPYLGELEPIIAQFTPNDSCLELGAGTGRLSAVIAPLVDKLTLVDNSQEMLNATLITAEKVCADITELNLNERFDSILLPSYLINHLDPEIRNAFVNTIKAHLGKEGRAFVQYRTKPSSLAPKDWHYHQGVEFKVEHRSLDKDVLHEKLGYKIGEKVWTHEHSCQLLSQTQFESLFREHQLNINAWLDPDWLVLQHD